MLLATNFTMIFFFIFYCMFFTLVSQPFSTVTTQNKIKMILFLPQLGTKNKYIENENTNLLDVVSQGQCYWHQAKKNKMLIFEHLLAIYVQSRQTARCCVGECCVYLLLICFWQRVTRLQRSCFLYILINFKASSTKRIISALQFLVSIGYISLCVLISANVQIEINFKHIFLSTCGHSLCKHILFF